MNISASPLVVWTSKGLYCPSGDFYIDPHRAVETAVVTHAHSDHAYRGSQKYICAKTSKELIRTRLGQSIQIKGIPFKKKFKLGDVQLSFHPAGHILGSAQVRIQKGPEVWVVSGDYKREADPSCEPFEVVPCDTFITEATFGTPKYLWQKNNEHGKDIFQWWQSNAEVGRNSVLFGYSLGKSQRILAELFPFAQRPILIHESISQLTECYRKAGRALAPTCELNLLSPNHLIQGELILAPPSLLKTEWLGRLGDFETAFASGWMQGSRNAHGVAYDRGFVISDHADWDDLNRTIQDTGANQVFILHRSQGALVRHLRKKGLDAHPIAELTLENYPRITSSNLSLF